MTYYGTGCIFHYDDEFKIGGKGFKESDKPNFTGSYYSYTKVDSLWSSFCVLDLKRADSKEQHGDMTSLLAAHRQWLKACSRSTPTS
jgi:hypothetical protein